MKNKFFTIPYFLWLALFVVTPLVMVLYQSFFDVNHHFTLANYATYFRSSIYLKMTFESIVFAFLVTLICLVLSYPCAYILTKLKHKELWLLLIILPTWVNLLLKAYAFIGIFSVDGSVNHFLSMFGVGPFQFLFTDLGFVLVAAYVEIPFMILPIFNSIEEIPNNLITASQDLGASRLDTFRKIVYPLSLPGVRSGIQAIFIPALSLFMLARLIGGNKVITLGTAIEEHFLSTQNWGMGSTIGIVLIAAMVVVMFVTRGGKKK